MILLDKRAYYKVKDPLLDVQINNLFARAVVENHVEGKVYVDDPENPMTFKYFMNMECHCFLADLITWHLMKVLENTR